MKTLSRAILPAMAILASVATAQAQTQTQDHQAHHPAGQSEQAQPAPTPMPAPGQGMGMMGMMGGGMGMMGGASGMPMGCPMMGQNRENATGGMQRMPMMGQGAMGMPFEYIEGRLAFLKAEIGITDDQAEAWDAFAGALRRGADVHHAMHKQMMGADAMAANTEAPSSWPERLDQHAKALSARAAALTAVSEAAGPLYGVLTEEQREKADRLLSGPMGMPMVAK